MNTKTIEAKKIRAAAETLRSVAHPVRLALLDTLEQGEQTVSDLQRIVGKQQAVVSQHLKILRDHGVVRARREGNRCLYQISHPAVHQILNCIRTKFTGPCPGKKGALK